MSSLPAKLTPPQWKIEVLGRGFQTEMPTLYTFYAGTEPARGMEFSVTEEFIGGVSGFKLTIPRPRDRGHIMIPSGSLVRFILPGLDPDGLLSPIAKIKEEEDKQIISGEGFIPYFEKLVPADIEGFRGELSRTKGASIRDFFRAALDGFTRHSSGAMLSTVSADLVNLPSTTSREDRHFPQFMSKNFLELVTDAIEQLNRPGIDRTLDPTGTPVRPIGRWRFWVDGRRRFRMRKLTPTMSDIHEMVQMRHFLDIDITEDSDTVRNSIAVFHKPTTGGKEEFSPSWGPDPSYTGSRYFDLNFPARDVPSIEKYGEKAARIDFEYQLVNSPTGPSQDSQGWEIAHHALAVLKKPYEECKIETKIDHVQGWGTHNLLLRNELRKRILWDMPNLFVPRGFSVPVPPGFPAFLHVEIEEDVHGVSNSGTFSKRSLKITKDRSPVTPGQLFFTLPESLWGAALFQTKIFLSTTKEIFVFFVFQDDFGNSYRVPIKIFHGEWIDVEIPILFQYTTDDLWIDRGPDDSEPMVVQQEPPRTPDLSKVCVNYLQSPAGEIGGILNLKNIILEIDSTDLTVMYLSWGLLDGRFSAIKRLPLKRLNFESKTDIKVRQIFGESIDPDTYLERLKNNTRRGDATRRLFTNHSLISGKRSN